MYVRTILLIIIIENILASSGLHLLPDSLTATVNTVLKKPKSLINDLIKDVTGDMCPLLTKRDLSNDEKAAFQAGMDDKDIDRNITQLIAEVQLPVESYDVCTEDGYILTMFRIPKHGGVPVLLMHGIISSADDFVTNGQNNSLPFLLARKGYDVWLGNARGNKHSRKHVSLSPDKDKKKYWHFSWDEIGRYDLPAMIDFILQTTNNQQLVYIGHSQGSTSFFVLTSELPAYNKKIKCMVALSVPVFLARNNSAVLQILARLASHQHDLLPTLLGPSILGSDLVGAFFNVICDDDTDMVTQLLCTGALFLVTGFNYEQAHFSRLGPICNHLVGNEVATNQFVHYAQCVKDGTFKQLDFGVLKNLELYGCKTSPDYNLDKITCAIAIFHGLGDWLSVTPDVIKLINHLKNANVTYFEVPDKLFAHLDYVYAKDATKLLYNDVLNYIEQC